MKSFRGIALVSIVGIGLGCGQSSQAVKAPDHSAENYRQQAARESAASHKELAAANGAQAAPNLNANGGNNPQGHYFDTNVCNTRDQPLAQAREPSQHAQQHEALAAKLESFEQTECIGCDHKHATNRRSTGLAIAEALHSSTGARSGSPSTAPGSAHRGELLARATNA
ncbi:MAG TPA: hypothetical protein VMT03_20145, partial [Polyangia bacterium]|nr:hypothetical protein [Polyangia bacterium]